MRVLRYGLIAIAALALLLGAAAVASFVYPRLRGIDYVNELVVLQRPLTVPPLLQPDSENGEKVFSLRVVPGQAELLQASARTPQGSTVRSSVRPSAPGAATGSGSTSRTS